jgi:hypothetical protein
MTNARLRISRALLFAATVATIDGCGSANRPAAPAAPAAQTAGVANQPARSTPSILIADDLRKSDAQNLGDAIQRLRPEWLRRSSARAANSMGTKGNAAEPLVVWIDNNRAGGTDILAQIQISNVRLVQFFTPSEAESRFGTGNSSGAIQVITMAGARP